MVLVDPYIPGFFLEIWRRWSRPYSLRLLRDEPFPPGEHPVPSGTWLPHQNLSCLVRGTHALLHALSGSP